MVILKGQTGNSFGYFDHSDGFITKIHFDIYKIMNKECISS